MSGEKAESGNPHVLEEQLSRLTSSSELACVREEAFRLLEAFTSQPQNHSWKGMLESPRVWSLCIILFASWKRNSPIRFKTIASFGDIDVFQFLKVCKKLSGTVKELEPYRETISSTIRRLTQMSMIQEEFVGIVPFLTTSVKKNLELDFCEGDVKQISELCWLFFLYSKKLLKEKYDIDLDLEIVSLFHLAISCFCLFFLHRNKLCRPKKRQKPLSTNEDSSETHEREVSNICDIAGAIEDDVRKFIRLVVQTIPEELLSMFPIFDVDRESVKKSLLKVAFEEFPNETVEEKTFDELEIFSSLPNSSVPSRQMEPSHPTKNLHVLAYLASGSLSEDSAIQSSEQEDTKGISKQFFGNVIHKDTSQVASSITAVSWLRKIARTRPEVVAGHLEGELETSNKLRQFCELCGSDMYRTIISNANQLVWSFLEKNSWYSKEVVHERKSEILGLYYHALEGMLIAEEKRLNQQNFCNLLNNSHFHGSLTACSILCSVACYGREDWNSILSILKGIEASAFEHTKIIVSFIATIENAPRNIQKFLLKSDEALVEYVCWQDFPFIEYLEKVLIDMLNAQSVDKDNTYLPLSFHADCVPESVPYSVVVFFRKLLRIASEKVREFCSRIPISAVFEELVLRTVNFILTRKLLLLKNRHVDTIIMCSIFAVSKIAKEPLKFNDIAAYYRDIHQKKGLQLIEIEDNLSRVYLEDEKYGDIIEFYNMYFIKNLRSFLLEYLKSVLEEKTTSLFEDNGKEISGPSTPNKVPLQSRSSYGQTYSSGADGMPYTPPANPRASPSRKIGKVTISPMSPEGRRQMARRTPMTPNTRALYAFGESPGEGAGRLSRLVSGGESSLNGVEDQLQDSRNLSLGYGAFGRYNSLMPVLVVASDSRPPLPPQERNVSS
eukprot:jgi/Galph1/122/GphlegSOOS_G4850.1